MDPNKVHETLAEAQLVDGYPLVLDLDRSSGVWMHDAKTGKRYLDAFTCFASWPVGYNHPMMHDAGFEKELLRAARTKVANSDIYTPEMAGFVEAFRTHVTPEGFPHHFWVSGGALAVENAMKTAFDWKARKLGRTSFEDDVNDLVILHFRQAFHGRSGYTMSVTNTVPDKIGLFPKFDWPRVHNPAIVFDNEGGVANDIEAEEARACKEIEAAFADSSKKVAAILIEPMQGEGGDNHFRTEFLQKLRDYADEHEALLIFDEVQTGFFGSGKAWLWQHHGVAPDIVSFGKKTQVCGIYASTRVDEVPENVFVRSSRINSTWGGNLVDMVRAHRFIEIIEAENLAANITERGQQLVAGLRSLAAERGAISNVRGRGSLVAFTLESPEAQQKMLSELFEKEMMALAAGPNSVRFRLPLVINASEVDEILGRVAECLPAGVA
ncbi:MAG TPA: L-lysine 6-transaminase [Planctomycetes bacterium]|nr:L-lysine 6-transaminase [Planctomycetota bacterium]